MEIVKICAILVVSSMLTLILKQQNNSMYHLISITATVIAGVLAVKSLTPILQFSKEFGAITPEILQILIRTLGISYLTDFSSSICKDVGETSLAAGVELCGKAEILILSLPLFSQLMELCTKIINQ